MLLIINNCDDCKSVYAQINCFNLDLIKNFKLQYSYNCLSSINSVDNNSFVTLEFVTPENTYKIARARKYIAKATIESFDDSLKKGKKAFDIMETIEGYNSWLKC